MFQQGSLQKNLQSLSLDDVKKIGKELGCRAYGVVVEVRVSGLVCAGRLYMKLLYRYIYYTYTILFSGRGTLNLTQHLYNLQ